MGIEEAILQEFKEKGLEEGREEGREETLRVFISRAQKKGIPVEEIAFLADASIEKVEAILQELEEEE